MGSQYTIGDFNVDFDSIPFSVGEKRVLDCQHVGEQRNPMGKRTQLQNGM